MFYLKRNNVNYEELIIDKRGNIKWRYESPYGEVIIAFLVSKKSHRGDLNYSLSV